MVSPRQSFLEKADTPYVLSLFLGLLTLNVFLVSPFIGWYDEGEMVGATACLGISHPSGQVLFHLLGKVFLLCPFGTPAFRFGLMSVFCSALASVLFWILCCRLAERFTKKNEAISPSLKRCLWLLTLAWSLSLPWWKYSLTPLVYALHLFLGLLVLWALSLERPSKWLLVFFILGSATIFRPTQCFALPFVGLAYLLEWKKRKIQRQAAKTPSKTFFDQGIKTHIFSVIAFALGRSTAIYLPLRSALKPAIAYADLTRLIPLVKHVLALRFSKYVGVGHSGTAYPILQQMAFHLWSELTPLGVALLVLGAIFLILNRKKIPLFLWVAMGWGTSEALFVLNIPFPTFESHQVLLGWVYSGFLAVSALIFLESRVRKNRIWSFILAVVLTAFVLIQFTAVGHLWERKKERGAQDYARNLLQIMEPNALYIPAEENEYFPVVGFQQSFNFRKDVEVVEPGLDPSEVGAKIRDCVEHNRPLYVTRQWVLPPTYFYQSWGPLWKIVPSSIERVARKNPKASPQVSWGSIGLVGAQVQPSVVQAGGILEVTYHWIRQKGSPADQTRSLVALFADDQGNYWTRDGVLWLQDIHEISSSYFTQMKPGWVYEEKRILFIPSDFPAGSYRLMMGFQKIAPTKGEGQESFNREFYERSAAQDLDKFMGKGGNGSVIQFSTLGPDVFKGGFWPVKKSQLPPPADPRFAPVANVEIEPAQN
jgi:hypothetical protein